MRTIQDGSFQRWEAFATTGDFGASNPARIVFRCLSDRGERPRAVFVEGDRAGAEARIRESDDAELMALFEESVPVD